MLIKLTNPLLVLIVLVVQIRGNPECFLKQENNDVAFRPIFVQKFGRETILLPSKDLGTMIPQSSFINVVCPSGFRRDKLASDLFHKITTETKDIRLTCSNGEISMFHEDELIKLDREALFVCQRPTISIYEFGTSRICAGTAYIVGADYGKHPITLAEICYDWNTMKPKYVYYKAGHRSPILSMQHRFSPVEFYAMNRESIDMPSATFMAPLDQIETAVNKKIGIISGSVEYVYDNLVPDGSFGQFFTDPLYSASFMGKALWWKNFKKGNWKLFEESLRNYSQANIVDVAIGTHGVVTVPSSNPNCDVVREISFEVNSVKQSAPKYIWAYVNVQETREEYVIIGFNSPFLDFFPRRSEIFCQDICDSISWLKPLNKFRRMAVFGYVFCCQPEAAQQHMGIPLHYTNRWYYDESQNAVKTDYNDENDKYYHEESNEVVETTTTTTTQKPFPLLWSMK